MRINIILGDITTSSSDCIVNAANTRLLAGSGVCGAIFRAAGYEPLQSECNKLAPIKTGEAVITNGYKLKAKYIIHTAGPIYEGPKDARLLRNSYYNSLKLANEYKLKSISFPSISTGIYGYPINEAVAVVFDSINEFINDYKNTSIENIDLYAFDEITYEYLLNEYNKRK